MKTASQRNHGANRHGPSERGVTMVQFAIAFPIFMMFVVVIVDYSRITAASNLVREGLAYGIKQAKSVPNLDIDPRGVPSTDYWYRRSKIAREIVEEEALALVRGTGQVSVEDDASTAGADGPKMYDLVFTENRISDGPDEETYKVAALLPGECVEVPSLGITECNRETLGTEPNDPFPLQPPEFLIEEHPVKVVAFVRFDTFTPWAFNQVRRFEQFGFRQPIPKTPFPTEIDPQPYGELPTGVEDQEPLGDARTPEEEEPEDCVFDWGKCTTQALDDGVPRCPCPGVPDLTDASVCTCRENCCGPDQTF